MNDKIEVLWDVNVSSGEEQIDPIDLGIESMEEWNNLSFQKQEELLVEYLSELDRVYIVPYNWG